MTPENSISHTPAEQNSCVIEPRKGRNEEILPPKGILVFSPEDLASFSARLSQPLRSSHRLYLSEVFAGSYEGTPIALAGPMLGAPQTVLVLEKMIALGARQFIAAGWCGSLRKDVRIGDIVLPTGAISEEGTSGHYPGVECTPSSVLSESLRSALASTGPAIHEGTVWTTDAPFRETHAKLKTFQSQGVLSVDMETSALFSVSRFRGVDLAVVLVVSDDLSGLKWVHGFRDPTFHESRKRVIESILAAICRV
ncbi:MAG: nucleoside phosphorylase [Syntrophobacteraceae bacterium]